MLRQELYVGGHGKSLRVDFKVKLPITVNVTLRDREKTKLEGIFSYAAVDHVVIAACMFNTVSAYDGGGNTDNVGVSVVSRNGQEDAG